MHETARNYRWWRPSCYEAGELRQAPPRNLRPWSSQPRTLNLATR